ncbi:uncharacterized protein DMAD_00556 [Drosophila madeirensis]|uniref:Uncharacterized protein n=1 Tax=Drosophila madeirensis TaxID=30013 RepID=A0AAU9FYR0_DROMD
MAKEPAMVKPAHAEELEKFYTTLAAGNILELQWQCPGYQVTSLEANSAGRMLPEVTSADTNSKELELKQQANDVVEQQ